METLSLVLNDTEVMVVAINATSEDATDKISKTLKNLNKLQGSILLKMNTLIVKAFNLCQQMSSPMLCIEWDNIVEKICFDKGLLNDKGVNLPSYASRLGTR